MWKKASKAKQNLSAQAAEASQEVARTLGYPASTSLP